MIYVHNTRCNIMFHICLSRVTGYASISIWKSYTPLPLTDLSIGPQRITFSTTNRASNALSAIAATAY